CAFFGLRVDDSACLAVTLGDLAGGFFYRDGTTAYAGARLAGVSCAAGHAIVARAAVGLFRIGAQAGGWIAHARLVARAERAARDGLAAHAHTRLAAVHHRAGIAVATGGSVGERFVRYTGDGIAAVRCAIIAIVND